LLNRLGMLAGEMGDTEREIKFYREAAKESNWSAPLFNLALTYKRQKRYKDAQEALDEALDRDPDGPYWILKAQLFELQKQPREKDEALQEAFAMMGTLKQMNEWELGWYEYAAHLAEKTDMASDIQKELNTRKKKGLAPSTGEPILPEIRSAIQRRED
ncbi:MAG TPA: tetratricopeptide repeat protein, partial [bacterium]|nr:tetratricopeptide repeat protein [bacterium]